MPVQRAVETPSSEESLDPAEELELAKLYLRRFCFLCSFEAVYSYRNVVNVKEHYKKLNEYCKLIEPPQMSIILSVAYKAVLVRRDEVALVYAVYLLGEIPINWKTELRSQFPTLVTTDEDLFMFCKYAAIIHHEKKQAVFCKTIKKAITSWYKSQTPEEIAHMFSINRGKHGFTHRSLIRMCRITDHVLGTKYLYQSVTSSSTVLLQNAENPLPSLPTPKVKPLKEKKSEAVKKEETVEKNDASAKKETKSNDIACDQEEIVKPLKDLKISAVKKDENSVESGAVEKTLEPAMNSIQTVCNQEKIRSLVLGISTLRTTTDGQKALEVIKEHELKYEHVPYHLLQYPDVLKTVAKSMTCVQLIKSLHSEKIRKHFAKQEVLKVCRERFQVKGGMKNECVDPIMLLMSMDKLSIEQPLKPTNNKNTSRGRLVQFSKQLYRMSFRETNPTNLRIHITMNLQQNYMKKVLKNTKSVNYQFAAVALAFTFFKVEEICDVNRWNEEMFQLSPVNWNKKMDFVKAFEACSSVQNTKNKQLLYVPIKESSEKNRVYDLFIAIVPAATRGNFQNSSAHLAYCIDRYRKMHNKNAKYVIIDLLRYKKSMKSSPTTCENILEICGIDEHTIPLIYNFALGKFD